MIQTINNRGSLVPLPAREVHRLAIQSLAEIDSLRKRATDAALKIAETEMKYRWFGLVSFPLYNSRECAMKHCPRIQHAQHAGWGDRLTCLLLKKAAETIMEIGTPDKVIYVALEDYRALI